MTAKVLSRDSGSKGKGAGEGALVCSWSERKKDKQGSGTLPLVMI